MKAVEYRGVRIKVLYRTVGRGQKLWSWKGVMPDGSLEDGRCFTNFKDADDVIRCAKDSIDFFIENIYTCPLELSCPSTTGAEHSFCCPNQRVCENLLD